MARSPPPTASELKRKPPNWLAIASELKNEPLVWLAFASELKNKPPNWLAFASYASRERANFPEMPTSGRHRPLDKPDLKNREDLKSKFSSSIHSIVRNIFVFSIVQRPLIWSENIFYVIIWVQFSFWPDVNIIGNLAFWTCASKTFGAGTACSSNRINNRWKRNK